MESELIQHKCFAKNGTSSDGPQLIVIMGVSGSGKSSIAQQLADDMECEFVEADDFHSQEAKQQMAENVPLTDVMRTPWVAAIIKELTSLHQLGKDIVLAYSGLKHHHRNQFRAINDNCHFFYLSGTRSNILSRLKNRNFHFFNSDLLDSQYDAMEVPQSDEKDVCVINVDSNLTDIYREIFNKALLLKEHK